MTLGSDAVSFGTFLLNLIAFCLLSLGAEGGVANSSLKKTSSSEVSSVET